MAVLVPRARAGEGDVAGAGGLHHDMAWAEWLVFGFVLIGAFAYLIWKGRGNSFFYDEWSWIESRRNGVQSVLGSYNDHMELVPLAVYQGLLHALGLVHYSVYRVLAAVGHLLVVGAVFEFARRRLGAAALLLATPIAFFGSGWEYELWGVNFGFTVSMAFGIGALLALDRGDRRGDITACGLLVGGLAFSESCALFAAGIAVAQLVFDRSLRRAWVWAVPIGLYGVWWLAYYEPLPSSHPWLKVPKFAADMAASAAGGLFDAGLQKGRLILLALIAVVGWRLIRRRSLSPSLLALLVTLFGFWLLVAVGRVGLGRPWASHYVYTGAVLIVLIVADSLRETHLRMMTLPVAVALSALALVGNMHAFAPGEGYLLAGARAVRTELGALQLARAYAPPTLVLDAFYAPQIQAAPYFAAVRALGSSPADSPAQLTREAEPERAAADTVLRRSGELQIQSDRGITRVARRPPVVLGAVSGVWAHQRSCVQFKPMRPGATFELLLPTSGVEVQAGAGSPARVWTRRLASQFQGPPISTGRAGGAVLIRPRPDSYPRPWEVKVSAPQAIRACTVP